QVPAHRRIAGQRTIASNRPLTPVELEELDLAAKDRPIDAEALQEGPPDLANDAQDLALTGDRKCSCFLQERDSIRSEGERGDSQKVAEELGHALGVEQVGVAAWQAPVHRYAPPGLDERQARCLLGERRSRKEDRSDLEQVDARQAVVQVVRQVAQESRQEGGAQERRVR